MAKAQITISDVGGRCKNCFNTKKENILKETKNENINDIDIEFSLDKHQIYINCNANHSDSLKSILKDLGYLEDNLKQVTIDKDIALDELNAAFSKAQPKQPKNGRGTWKHYLKPMFALLIGYTELCCVLMAWLPTHVWFIISGFNLGLIMWQGWDYFATAKQSLMYLTPVLFSLIGFISMPFLLPGWVAAHVYVWTSLTVTSMVALVGLAWYKRGTLSMETLIALSITMAWAFSTLQLLIPALSAAFGAQLYFQDSMIILGVVGLAQQIKQAWVSDKKTWQVYENHKLVNKHIEGIVEGNVIRLETNIAYPFPLQLIQGDLEVDCSIPNDAPGQTRKVQQDAWIQPWERIQTIQGEAAQLARVGSFRKAPRKNHPGWADNIAQYFLPIMLTLACTAGIVWYVLGPVNMAVSYAIKAFMGVLMAACPCVLGVVAPICESIGKQKIRAVGANLKEHVSVGHLASIQKIVFDKTGTLTEMQSSDDTWPMRQGCDENLTLKLHKQNKAVFILSGDGDFDRKEAIVKHMAMDPSKVICHPIFSTKYANNAHISEDYYKTILLEWLAHPSRQEYPPNIVKLAQSYYVCKDEAEQASNVQAMAQALEVLKDGVKLVEKTHILYVDDGPGLSSPKQGCLTLQCVGRSNKTEYEQADGQIENPATLSEVFDYMQSTHQYLNQQLNLAWLYNIIAIPLMAGALFFWFMPSPWMGALLMNTFSMFLIYRARNLETYLEGRVLPIMSRQGSNPSYVNKDDHELSLPRQGEDQNELVQGLDCGGNVFV